VFSSVQILATFSSRGKWDSHCLMIDGMVSQLGKRVEKWWRRDEGGTGKYPPASLHVSAVFTESSNTTTTHPKAKEYGKTGVFETLTIFHFRHCWISIC